MLARIHGKKRQGLASLEIGQHTITILSLAFRLLFAVFSFFAGRSVSPFDVNFHETVKLDLLPGGAKQRFSHRNLKTRLIEYRRHHLTGNEPIPDQRVELESVAAQIRPDSLRGVLQRSRSNRLMSVLRALFRAIAVWLAGKIVFSIMPADELAHRGERIVGHASRIGSHVSNQSHGTFLPELHAFVELLGQLHGSFGLKTQLSRRLLLQFAGDERRRRIAPSLLLLDFVDDP